MLGLQGPRVRRAGLPCAPAGRGSFHEAFHDSAVRIGSAWCAPSARLIADEWAEGRRYISLDLLTKARAAKSRLAWR